VKATVNRLRRLLLTWELDKCIKALAEASADLEWHYAQPVPHWHTGNGSLAVLLLRSEIECLEKRIPAIELKLEQIK
jgi:hypothetical protein